MMQYNMVQAERISQAIERTIEDMISTMCEQEAPEVQQIVWGMLATRIAFASGRGECFVLPPLEDC